MANRAARLQKEAQILRARTLERQALRRVKRREKLRKPTSLIKVLQQLSNALDTTPKALRRQNVQTSLQLHAQFFLGIVKCCERSNRLEYLQAWKPPRTRDTDQVYQSLCEQVLNAAPLKKHQMERLENMWAEPVYPHITKWLEFLVTNPEMTALLPTEPSMFLKKLLDKIFEAPAKYQLPEALRYAQVSLMGVNKGLAKMFAEQVSIGGGLAELSIAKLLYFLAQPDRKLSRPEISEVLTFIQSPFQYTPDNVYTEFQARYGWPMLDFEVEDGRMLLNQISRHEERIEQLKQELHRQPFPKPPMPDNYAGRGKYAGLRIERLKNEYELIKEAQILSHCVDTYGEYCMNGEGSIWRLSRDGAPVATIELRRHRKVVQFKGRRNEKVAGRYRAFLDQWLSQYQLGFESW